MRKEVDKLKKWIRSQIDSIIQYRRANSEQRKESQYGCLCPRYCYPPSEKYALLENNRVFNVVRGRECEPSFARDCKISINEIIAFQINSDAKFAKVYREGITKCFLMPAEFKDDTMRNFFRSKFEDFVNGPVNYTMKDGDHKLGYLCGSSSSSVENADFAEEHFERCKTELEYLKGRGTDVVDLEKVNHDMFIDCESPPETRDFFAAKENDKGVSCSLFNQEAGRSRKHFVDARDVCLSDWEVRDKAQELLEKVCVAIKESIGGKHVGCDCNKQEVHNCTTCFEYIDVYFKLLKKTNRESENAQCISQILDNTLFVLDDILKRFREYSCFDMCTEIDKELMCDSIDAHQQFYFLLGTHNTSLFYEK